MQPMSASAPLEDAHTPLAPPHPAVASLSPPAPPRPVRPGCCLPPLAGCMEPSSKSLIEPWCQHLKQAPWQVLPGANKCGTGIPTNPLLSIRGWKWGLTPQSSFTITAALPLHYYCIATALPLHHYWYHCHTTALLLDYYCITTITIDYYKLLPNTLVRTGCRF